MRKLVPILIAAALAALGPRHGALGSYYAQTSSRGTASDPRPEPDQTIRIYDHGGYFRPGTLISLNIFSHRTFLGSTVADTSGDYDLEVRIPADTTPGPHQIRATGTNRSGAMHTSTIDIVVEGDAPPPDTVIDSGPEGTVASARATFTFRSSHVGSTFGCSLDGADPAACTSPKAYEGLTEGIHVFRVAAFGDTSPAVRTWKVDTLPPDTTITSGPPPETLSDEARFTFSSSEGGPVFRCRFDAGQIHACGSPYGVSGLAEGTHTFDVRAVDDAGNVDPAPDVRTWQIVVDRTPPDVSFVRPGSALYVFDAEVARAGGGAPLVLGPVAVVARATDDLSGVDRVRFAVDGVPVPGRTTHRDADTWGFTFRGSPGAHTVEAVATDRAGHGSHTEIQIVVLG